MIIWDVSQWYYHVHISFYWCVQVEIFDADD